MQPNISQLKLQLIYQIMHIQNAHVLEQMLNVLPLKTEDEDLLARLSRPIPDTLDLEQIKKSQGFTKFDLDKMQQLRTEINLTEPIEPLLVML